MTGLIYNKPKEPLKFLETAIAQIRANPEEELTWDMFIDKGKLDRLRMFWFSLFDRFEHRAIELFNVSCLILHGNPLVYVFTCGLHMSYELKIARSTAVAS